MEAFQRREEIICGDLHFRKKRMHAVVGLPFEMVMGKETMCRMLGTMLRDR